jgi:hypothetical protein
MEHVFDCWRVYCLRPRNSKADIMLLLTAILSAWAPREPEPNDLLAEARQRIGHVGLAVIALVFVLLAFWQH